MMCSDAVASTALSTMYALSTIFAFEHRHVTQSIYQYLQIHRQDGYRALYIASRVGQIEVVKLLLDRGADIEATDNVSHNTMEPTKSDTV